MFEALNAYGEQGVAALQAFTPVESGETANSWYYEIEQKGKWLNIVWYNANLDNGFPVAVMLQHGHGTGTGGYVVGRDYINPALRPIFDEIADKVWRAVTSA